jgi:peroxiredoxin
MSTLSTDTSLTAAANDLRRNLIEQAGADTIALFDRDAEALGRRDFASSAPQVGDRAPGFRLPDARGGHVALGELLADGPVVVVFYRGAWCPYCNLQLAALQGGLADIEAAGATLVAISPQTPDASLTLAEQHALRFAVLSDAGNAVAAEYGLVFEQAEEPTAKQRELGIDLAEFNGDDSHRLPAASTFVVAPDGTIRFTSISADYRWRVGPEDLLPILRELRG